jgi:hypothetical protein
LYLSKKKNKLYCQNFADKKEHTIKIYSGELPLPNNIINAKEAREYLYKKESIKNV